MNGHNLFSQPDLSLLEKIYNRNQRHPGVEVLDLNGDGIHRT
jgi:hypothetical protein